MSPNFFTKIMLFIIINSALFNWHAQAGSSDYQKRAFVAFLGDSLSTGAVAHPNLKLTSEAMNAILTDSMSYRPDGTYATKVRDAGFDFSISTDDIERQPRRLFLSSREYDEPFLWFVNHVGLLFSERYLDTEAYAWSYFVGRQLGYEAEDIWIAAKDGEKSTHATAQMARVLEASGGRAPDHLFMFFTGNDLCAATPQATTSASDYAGELKKAIEYLRVNMKARSPDEGPVHIWVLNPVGVLQIVTKASILSLEVPYGKKQITCKELQTNRPQQASLTLPESNDLGSVLLSAAKTIPASYCPSLFAVHGERGSDTNIMLSDRLRSYGKAIEKLTENMRASLASRDIYLNQISDTSKVLFEGEDMANDCFHLNLNGHLKVAHVVRSFVNDLLKTDR